MSDLRDTLDARTTVIEVEGSTFGWDGYVRVERSAAPGYDLFLEVDETQGGACLHLTRQDALNLFVALRDVLGFNDREQRWGAAE